MYQPLEIQWPDRYRPGNCPVHVKNELDIAAAQEHVWAWLTHALGVDAYHAWVLQPSTQGCHVLTEETQHGWITRLGKLFIPNRMGKFHQLWLEGLETRARTGLPPNAAGVPLSHGSQP
jgi:hypothetical protein